jgi:hypothetical protein
MSRTTDPGTADYGLSYLLLTCVGIVMMITINGGIVELFLSGWVMDRPFWLDDKRVLMAIGKIAPFLLLVCEYWVLDFILDRWRQSKSSSPNKIA